MADTEKHKDYTTGEIRKHHEFYLSDGNVVIQVEKALFNVHCSFLAKQSSVFSEMFRLPQADSTKGGTDEDPIILMDEVQGWETLLNSLYRVHFLKAADCNTPEMLTVLRIAHKYNMELVEEDILDKLKTASTTSSYVDLMVASQIVDSQSLYQQALQGLIKSNSKPDLAQARRIGVDAYHAVMSAGPQVPAVDRMWIHCATHSTVGTWGCSACHEYVR
ncbi:hypothetical protein M408DRAFT_334392 [Serendipita vermifera MAFF 305830]|uniref:BTB domain-containing protein n=1 Tax=Serendipita vermifera MAFF 305830 TaxID=933852 RepID=A0A0C2VYT2_SERVB|nr:hypothetical protein M408DRAFT_334392 [Serendipita vermifera MAFF 305830]